MESCGYPRDTAIPVEGDGRYNNPLYWSWDRNPFQPAAQASYTISENITQDKKIIVCTTRNKLCSKRNRRDNCAEHPGECAATLPYQNPIGMEDQAVEEICREFLSDPEPNIIIHITTDGDSTAFRGAEKAMAEQKTWWRRPRGTLGTWPSPIKRPQTMPSLAPRCFREESLQTDSPQRGSSP